MKRGQANFSGTVPGLRDCPSSKNQSVPLILILLVALCVLSLVGCVRLTGGAGYTKVNAEGEATTKKVGFDTADYIPGSSAPGSITT